MSKKNREKPSTSRPVGEHDDEIRVLLAELSLEEGSLLRCLQFLNEHFGYVPESGIGVISELCNVSRAETYGVLTYYADLRTVPRAQVSVRLCGAEACQSVGSRELEHNWKELQALDFGGESVETSEVFCLGNCALGPSALVNDQQIGRTTSEILGQRVREILTRA